MVRGRGGGRRRGQPSGRLRAGVLAPRGGGSGGQSEVSGGPEGSQNRPLWGPGGLAAPLGATLMPHPRQKHQDG